VRKQLPLTAMDVASSACEHVEKVPPLLREEGEVYMMYGLLEGLHEASAKSLSWLPPAEHIQHVRVISN
jgi:hypothetical protein